jgi:predicted HD superfamily hydrolase involved in NAD metabolism
MAGEREIAIDIEINKGKDTQEFSLVLKDKMTAKRWQHSLGVAETAKKLALFWGADPEKAWLAGIFHDYARELPKPQLIKIATAYGLPVLKEERDNPVVLHAPIGALLVKDDFNIKDEEILSAISKHTVGGESLTLLDKIIFLADLVEPGRNWPGVEKLRTMVYQDLKGAMKEALDGTIQYLKEQGRTIHPITLLTWQNLGGNNRNQ